MEGTAAAWCVASFVKMTRPYRPGFRVSSLALFAVVLNDLNDLIVLGRPAAAMSHVKPQRGAAYDTTHYDGYAGDTREAFFILLQLLLRTSQAQVREILPPFDSRSHMVILGALETSTWKLHVLSGQLCCPPPPVLVYSRCYRVHQCM